MDTLYTSRGEPIAYIDDDGQSIYLFNGEPEAWLSKDRVYTYRGSYLGWYQAGWIYDRFGKPALFTSGASGGPAKPARSARPAKRALREAGTWCSRSGSRSPSTQHVLVNSVGCPILQAVERAMTSLVPFGQYGERLYPVKEVVRALGASVSALTHSAGAH